MVRKLLFIIIILILAVSACSGGTAGSVTGSRQSCQGGSGEVTCDGKINKLSGTYTLDLETSYFREGDAVLVEAYFTVESGQMRVSIEAPDGTLEETQAVPGEIAILFGLATAESSFDENAVPITLQAVNGDVEGIVFEIYLSQP
jgi:hypothetical protein